MIQEYCSNCGKEQMVLVKKTVAEQPQVYELYNNCMNPGRKTYYATVYAFCSKCWKWLSWL